jgi:3-polyprenyl-4-hydroxybenzoate decarboxylase
MPSFYMKPQDLDSMAIQFAGRICDQIGLHVVDFPRWQGV